jgi:hypothetical protein
MLLFSFVFYVLLDAETEVVVQIPSAEIFLIPSSGERAHFFMDTESSNYETADPSLCRQLPPCGLSVIMR